MYATAHSPTNYLRCASADCGRIFPRDHATQHIDGDWSEAHGVRQWTRTTIDCCPYCAGETDEVVVCNACHDAEPEQGCDQCTDCIAMEEADWKERLKQYQKNAPDFERAVAAYKEIA